MAQTGGSCAFPGSVACMQRRALRLVGIALVKFSKRTATPLNLARHDPERSDFIAPHQHAVEQRSPPWAGLREAIPLPHLAPRSKEAAA
jgi:hypothetical protein